MCVHTVDHGSFLALQQIDHIYYITIALQNMRSSKSQTLCINNLVDLFLNKVREHFGPNAEYSKGASLK